MGLIVCEGYISSARSRVRALGRSKKVCTLSQKPYQKQHTLCLRRGC